MHVDERARPDGREQVRHGIARLHLALVVRPAVALRARLSFECLWLSRPVNRLSRAADYDSQRDQVVDLLAAERGLLEDGARGLHPSHNGRACPAGGPERLGERRVQPFLGELERSTGDGTTRPPPSVRLAVTARKEKIREKCAQRRSRSGGCRRKE